jgi:hypothetical protein
MIQGIWKAIGTPRRAAALSIFGNSIAVNALFYSLKIS